MAGAPYAAIVVAIFAAGLLLPMYLNDQGEAIINLLASPVGLLFLCIGLVLTIQILSSTTGSFLAGIFSSGGADRDSVHRVSTSPVGVVLILVLVLVLLHFKVNIFSNNDDDEKYR